MNIHHIMDCGDALLRLAGLRTGVRPMPARQRPGGRVVGGNLLSGKSLQANVDAETFCWPATETCDVTFSDLNAVCSTRKGPHRVEPSPGVRQ